ncbi:MAG: DMT family transporter [Chlamydiales bacterium]
MGINTTISGMLRGTLYALIACFVWGFIFIIPNLLLNFSSVEVVLGRYITYGIFSCCLLFRKGTKILRLFPPKAWLVALIFSCLSNLCYYFGVVWGLRYASAPLTVLIVALAPIVIALYGNWHVREISYRHLIFPCVWITAGVVLVNITEMDWSFSQNTVQEYIVGLFGIFVALMGWSLYVVHNARFLKKNSHLPRNEWASVIGSMTLVLSLFIALFFLFVVRQEIVISRFTHFSSELLKFIAGVTVLGVACSWVGCFFWNKASTYLPVSIMGPYMIFETLFGLLFVYAFELHVPSWMELTGIAVLLSGILFALMIFRSRKYTHS